MKALALLAVIVGSSMAAPAKLDGLGHHQHHHGDDHHHHHNTNDPLANLFAQGSSRGGYDYEPPAVPSGLYDPPPVPSGLYELPTDKVEVTSTTTTTTTTTTTPPPPPPPPVDSYLPPPPDAQPSAAESVDVIVPSAGTTTMMPMPYNINWAVQDSDSGNRFSHVENSDGKDVTGEYSVLLPDNRLQIVRFTADPVNGYQAEVFYEPAK